MPEPCEVSGDGGEQMRKLSVSARNAVPVRTIAMATLVVALFPSSSDALDRRYEDGDGTSSWDTRAG